MWEPGTRRAADSRPYGETRVCTVGAGLVPARLWDADADRREGQAPPLRGDVGCIVGVGALDDPFVGQEQKVDKRAIRESPLQGRGFAS